MGTGTHSSPARYSIISVLRTPTVNPGESIEIDLYLTGMGTVEKNQLTVLHSHPRLLECDNCANDDILDCETWDADCENAIPPDSQPVNGNRAQLPDESVGANGATDPGQQREVEGDPEQAECADEASVETRPDSGSTRTKSGFIQLCLGYNNEGELLVGEDAIEHEDINTSVWLKEAGIKYCFKNNWFSGQDSPDAEGPDTPLNLLEQTHDGIAPIKLCLRTGCHAPPGDYTTSIVLTYQTNGETHQHREDVMYHVNSTREVYEPIPTYAIIASALFALFGILFNLAGVF